MAEGTMMIIQLRIPIAIARPAGPNGGRVRVELPADLKDWTLGLCLLAAELVDGIRLSDSDAELVVEVDSRLKPADRGIAVLEEARVKITLSRTELEVWQYFFLRAFRDGAPEVDHLDVELKAAVRGARVVDLMLKLSNAMPPMSGADATKILLGKPSRLEGQSFRK